MTNQNAAVPLGEDGDIEKLRELSDAAPAGPFEAWGDDIGHASGEGPVLASAHRPGLAQFLAGSINYVRAALARANNTDPVRKAIRKARNIADGAGMHPSRGHLHADGMRRACNIIEAALASAPPSAPEPEVHGYDPTERRETVTIRWPDGKCLGYVLDRTRYTDNLPPSASVGVDDALIAGAMEAAADACSRHVVCNEAITAAVEYALAQQPAAVDGANCEKRPLSAGELRSM